MEERVKAQEVPETRAEPAPAAASPSPLTTPAPDRAPGDTRGIPARPKKLNGDYEGDPWGEDWFPRHRRKSQS
jgi:hypothetical protein